MGKKLPDSATPSSQTRRRRPPTSSSDLAVDLRIMSRLSVSLPIILLLSFGFYIYFQQLLCLQKDLLDAEQFTEAESKSFYY